MLPMKHPILQKLTFTAIALAATLALSAQAGTPGLSTAKQTFGPGKNINPIHQLLFPAATYMIDDGTAEDAVGFGDGSQNFESLWFNQFDVIPGAETISSVEIAWGSPASADAINGTPVTIAVWSDPNGDGNPSDALLLGQVAGTIQDAGTNTLVTYTFPTPVALPAGATSFFVGDMTPSNSGPQHFYQGIDQDSVFHRQSWVAAMSSGAPVDINMIGNNDFLGLIDDFGLPGNWLIRANATGGGGGGDLTLDSAVSRKTHAIRGTFDIPLPLTGDIGIEDRTDGPKDTLVLTFNNNVTGAASASSTCGRAGVSVDPADAHNLIVEVGSVSCDQQVITVTVSGITDDEGNTLDSASVTYGKLFGDVDGNGTVNKADVSATRAVSGQRTNSENFRADVNTDGRINNQDIGEVKGARGHTLP